jgi:8-oxo-dGTP pyrophosphatase MutT (NUDIX family)
MTSPFQRHIAACNNLALPAGLVPFRIGGARVGWLSPGLAEALAALPGDGFRRDATGGLALDDRLDGPEARTEALEGAAHALAGRGFLRLRGEAFDVRATPEGPVLARLDRGALPAFGILSQGVHVNGRVRRADGGLHLWMGWRAKDKAVAPGKLDNLIAGGIPAGLTAEATLEKEAAEEASVPPELARQALRVGRVSYVMATEEGTRRDVLHLHDLDLPEGFTPEPHDDEVERFELWPIRRVLEAVRDTESVKFNVNLVLIDLFLREGLIDPAGEEGRRLRAGLDQGV